MYVRFCAYFGCVGPNCCTRALSSWGEWRPSLVAHAQASYCGDFGSGAGALGARASVVVVHGLSGSVASSWTRDLSSVPLALAVRFLTTEPPGKPEQF